MIDDANNVPRLYTLPVDTVLYLAEAWDEHGAIARVGLRLGPVTDAPGSENAPVKSIAHDPLALSRARQLEVYTSVGLVPIADVFFTEDEALDASTNRAVARHSMAQVALDRATAERDKAGADLMQIARRRKAMKRAAKERAA